MSRKKERFFFDVPKFNFSTFLGLIKMNQFWSKFQISKFYKKLDFRKKKSGSLCISTYRVYFGSFLGSNGVKLRSNPKDSKKSRPFTSFSLHNCKIVTTKNLSHVSVCFLEGVTDAMIISCRARNNDDATSSRVSCCERQPD